MEHGIKNFKLVVMGCSFPNLFPSIASEGNMGTFGMPYSEHNIACDVESSDYVLN